MRSVNQYILNVEQKIYRFTEADFLQMLSIPYKTGLLMKSRSEPNRVLLTPHSKSPTSS